MSIWPAVYAICAICASLSLAGWAATSEDQISRAIAGPIMRLDISFLSKLFGSSDARFLKRFPSSRLIPLRRDDAIGDRTGRLFLGWHRQTPPTAFFEKFVALV